MSKTHFTFNGKTHSIGAIRNAVAAAEQPLRKVLIKQITNLPDVNHEYGDATKDVLVHLDPQCNLVLVDGHGALQVARSKGKDYVNARYVTTHMLRAAIITA